MTEEENNVIDLIGKYWPRVKAVLDEIGWPEDMSREDNSILRRGKQFWEWWSGILGMSDEISEHSAACIIAEKMRAWLEKRDAPFLVGAVPYNLLLIASCEAEIAKMKEEKETIKDCMTDFEGNVKCWHAMYCNKLPQITQAKVKELEADLSLAREKSDGGYEQAAKQRDRADKLEAELAEAESKLTGCLVVTREAVELARKRAVRIESLLNEIAAIDKINQKDLADLSVLQSKGECKHKWRYLGNDRAVPLIYWCTLCGAIRDRICLTRLQNAGKCPSTCTCSQKDKGKFVGEPLLLRKKGGLCRFAEKCVKEIAVEEVKNPSKVEKCHGKGVEECDKKQAPHIGDSCEFHAECEIRHSQDWHIDCLGSGKCSIQKRFAARRKASQPCRWFKECAKSNIAIEDKSMCPDDKKASLGCGVAIGFARMYAEISKKLSEAS